MTNEPPTQTDAGFQARPKADGETPDEADGLALDALRSGLGGHLSHRPHRFREAYMDLLAAGMPAAAPTIEQVARLLGHPSTGIQRYDVRGVQHPGGRDVE